MSKNHLLSLIAALLFSSNILALTGKVVTPELQPLKGANVTFLNGIVSTQTDNNGEFFIDVILNARSEKSAKLNQNIRFQNKNFLFSLSQSEKVTIEAFNFQGRKLFTLVNKVLGAGLHKFEFPVSKTPNQNLMLKVSTGKTSSSYKLTPYGIKAHAVSSAPSEKHQTAALQITDSLIVTHPDYPRLAVPYGGQNTFDTIIMTDSTGGAATDIHISIHDHYMGSEVYTDSGLREGAFLYLPDSSKQMGYTLSASSNGYYTELYRFIKENEVVFLDLDTVPKGSGVITGVLMGHQHFFGSCYARNVVLTIRELGISDTTDMNGRYLFTGIPDGDYHVDFSYMFLDQTFTVSTGVYSDFIFEEPMQAEAPNVYLYPQTTQQVSLSVSFPTGGKVIVSEPDYGEGWTVTADPSGMIDDTIPYLFYEAKLNGPFSSDKGWIISEEHLADEFTSLMQARGFTGREITDFIQYWMPVLEGAAPYFAVYPQRVEDLIEHHVTPQPQSVLRELWLIRPLQFPLPLPQPEPVQFTRAGFTLVEWGVLLTRDLLERKNQVYD